MDKRLRKLSPWQMEVYQFIWKYALNPKNKELELILYNYKKKDPEAFEEAFKVWEVMCLDTLY